MVVLSNKLINCTHWGIYRLLPTFNTRIYVCFTNTIVSSLAAGQTINVGQDIFLHWPAVRKNNMRARSVGVGWGHC